MASSRSSSGWAGNAWHRRPSWRSAKRWGTAMPADQAFVSVGGLAKHFGGIHAVRDLSFGLARSEIVGLIGPNGSGKTTTINMLTGVLKPDGGTIAVEGVEMARAPAHHFARSGVARTFQVP